MKIKKILTNVVMGIEVILLISGIVAIITMMLAYFKYR